MKYTSFPTLSVGTKSESQNPCFYPPFEIRDFALIQLQEPVENFLKVVSGGVTQKTPPLSEIFVIRRGVFRALDFPVTRRSGIGNFFQKQGGSSEWPPLIFYCFGKFGPSEYSTPLLRTSYTKATPKSVDFFLFCCIFTHFFKFPRL